MSTAKSKSKVEPEEKKQAVFSGPESKSFLSKVLSDPYNLALMGGLGAVGGLFYAGFNNLAAENQFVVNLPLAQQNFDICPALGLNFQKLDAIRHLNEPAYENAFVAADMMLGVLRSVNKHTKPGCRTLVQHYQKVILSEIDLICIEARDTKRDAEIAQKCRQEIKNTLNKLISSYMPRLKAISLLPCK